MQHFHKTNIYIGWAFFLIAAVVYTLTVEPTASFWDCAEYIATAAKLQVPHPPGAPFFLLLGRMFSFFACGDVTRIAFWMNMSSVLASAGSVMMVFRIVTLLGRKALQKNAQTLLPYEACTVWAAGIIGALALTFSDTFWFTATETETYAFSNFIMIFVVWAMLHWTTLADGKQAHRWLILIAYLVGISIGLRIFSLLAIPALSLIFYFKKIQNPSLKGALVALGLGGLIITAIYVGVIPGLPTVAMWFELFFVNTLHLPFGSGIIVFCLIFVGSLVYGMVYSIKKQKEIFNVALLCFTFIIIGYSAYALVLIRARANPPINENKPDGVVNFISYLQREQYGSRPLLYGPYFTAKVIDQQNGAPIYKRGTDGYEIKGYKPHITYDPKSSTIFPRIWSHLDNHVAGYRAVLHLKEGQNPTFWHNLQFLLAHQLGHFYFRYFLWNFSGRQSDIQNAGWLTPIDALKKVPDTIAQNRARNNYFMLPLLLGLLGLRFQYRRDRKNFWVLLTLFFMLGVALVLFLNPPSVEPRERDYIYAGSFLIFTVWIGLGVLPVIHYLKKTLRNTKAAVAVGTALCLFIPLRMATQAWGNHDRSHRYFSIDSAKNFLASCAPNAVLFTGGDNDTFPLWYVQEVEGFRTDVRVIVITYFNTDWYIAQMTRAINASMPLPFSLTKTNYQQEGLNDYLPYIQHPGIRGAVDVKQFLQLVKAAHPALQVATPLGNHNTLPSKNMYLAIDKNEVLQQDIIPKDKQHLLVNHMEINVKGGGLEKKDLMILDLIANGHWQRPIYFDATSLHSINLDLKDYVIEEGTTFRLLPIKNSTALRMVNAERMYDNLMHKFYWRGLDNPKVYYDENYRNFILNHRAAFNTLAQALLQQNQVTKAKAALLKCLTVMPDAAIPYDPSSANMAGLLFRAGENEQALAIASTICKRADGLLSYKTAAGLYADYDTQKNLAMLYELVNALGAARQDALAEEYKKIFYKYYQMLDHIMR